MSTWRCDHGTMVAQARNIPVAPLKGGAAAATACSPALAFSRATCCGGGCCCCCCGCGWPVTGTDDAAPSTAPAVALKGACCDAAAEPSGAGSCSCCSRCWACSCVCRSCCCPVTGADLAAPSAAPPAVAVKGACCAAAASDPLGPSCDISVSCMFSAILERTLRPTQTAPLWMLYLRKLTQHWWESVRACAAYPAADWPCSTMPVHHMLLPCTYRAQQHIYSSCSANKHESISCQGVQSTGV